MLKSISPIYIHLFNVVAGQFYVRHGSRWTCTGQGRWTGGEATFPKQGWTAAAEALRAGVSVGLLLLLSREERPRQQPAGAHGCARFFMQSQGRLLCAPSVAGNLKERYFSTTCF